MSQFPVFTDEYIHELTKCPKRTTAVDSSWVLKRGHRQKKLHVVCALGYDYQIYIRTNDIEPSQNSWSVGIGLELKDATLFPLRRYDGPSHIHTNALERDSFAYACHIHYATERYQILGFDPVGYAKVTERFATLSEALACLLMDFNIIYNESVMAILAL